MNCFQSNATLLLALWACGCAWLPPDDGGTGGFGPQDTGAVGDTGCAAPSIWYADLDGDGYGDPAAELTACTQPEGSSGTADDCDDGDAVIHPGADERCNGIDDDCDEDVDEGLASSDWFDDADGDGYGDPTSAVTRCDPPESGVDVGGDCDDTDSTVHPGVEEVCDGVDNNCVDGEADAPGARLYFADTDGDGYGDPDNLLYACPDFLPSGYVSNDGDCEDTLPEVNKGAAGEVCDNGVDDDCNGSPDECSFVGSV